MPAKRQHENIKPTSNTSISRLRSVFLFSMPMVVTLDGGVLVWRDLSKDAAAQQAFISVAVYKHNAQAALYSSPK